MTGATPGVVGMAATVLLAGVIVSCREAAPVEPEPETGCLPEQLCSSMPLPVQSTVPFTEIAAGGGHTCALTADGEAWCWGRNENGELGADFAAASSAVPVRVAGNHHFASISLGREHTCALDADSRAWCWGANGNGALGTEAPMSTCADACSRVPVPVAGDRRWHLLDAGGSHTCGFDLTATLSCWGFNHAGAVGSTAYDEIFHLPVTIETDEWFESLSAGDHFTCGVTAESALWCWGIGTHGQIAQTTLHVCGDDGVFLIECSPTPMMVGFLSRFGDPLSAGGEHACVWFDRHPGCFGRNHRGQLGIEPSNQSRVPQYDRDVDMQIVAAGGAFTCILTPEGRARCCGTNDQGQLGNGEATALSWQGVDVSGGRTYVRISAGAEHACAIDAEGAAWCWGSDATAQLGDG